MTPRWLPYAAASFLLSLLDAATTRLAAHRHGWQWEANPLWQQSLAEESLAAYGLVGLSFAACAALLVVAFERVREGLGTQMAMLWLAIQGTVVASNLLSWLIGPAYFTRIFWFFPVVALAVVGFSMRVLTQKAAPVIIALAFAHLLVVVLDAVLLVPHFLRLAGPLFLILVIYPVMRGTPLRPVTPMFLYLHCTDS